MAYCGIYSAKYKKIAEMFPKLYAAARFVGITLLFAMYCVFLYRTNKGLKDGEIFPNSNTILIPFIVLLFAGLYKMAYLAAKDSKLAI